AGGGAEAGRAAEQRAAASRHPGRCLWFRLASLPILAAAAGGRAARAAGGLAATAGGSAAGQCLDPASAARERRAGAADGAQGRLPAHPRLKRTASTADTRPAAG